MEKTTKAAQGRWREILLELGVDSKHLENRHQPCPICEGRDRYRFDDKDGSGSYFCSGCGAGKGIDLLMKLNSWNFARAAREVDAVLGINGCANGPLSSVPVARVERSTADKERAIEALLRATLPISSDTPAARYLVQRCGPLDEENLKDLFYHKQLRHSDESSDVYPALISILRFADGSRASVMRTYLTLAGEKASVEPVRKVMSCASMKGSAVRLGALQERLGIAEGIETALCASKMFGFPVWAALTANGVESWQPPTGVRSVAVCGDNDANYTGQAAAFALAKRLVHSGLAVDVRIPPVVGFDWANCWANRARKG